MAEDGKYFDGQILEEVQEILELACARFFIRAFNKVKNWTCIVAVKSKGGTKHNLSYSQFIHLS